MVCSVGAALMFMAVLIKVRPFLNTDFASLSLCHIIVLLLALLKLPFSMDYFKNNGLA